MMVFHHRQRNISQLKLNLSINGVIIEEVSEFNFLGIMLDKNLSWNSHAQKIASMISIVNGILCRLKRFVPSDVLQTIYNALIQPLINYGILLWGKNTKRVLKLQKWAVRSMTCSKYNAHTDPLFINLKLLKVDDIYKLSALKFYFKYNKDILPNYFNGMFDPLYLSHQYDTRHREEPVVAIPNTEAANKSIRYALPKLVSNTSSSVTEKIATHPFTGLSNYAKQYYISQYKPTCEITNCWVCRSSSSSV